MISHTKPAKMLLLFFLFSGVCFADNIPTPEPTSNSTIIKEPLPLINTDWADAHMRVQSSLAGKYDQNREEALWALLADTEPLVAKTAAQELLVEPAIAARLFNDDNVPLDQEARESAEDSFMELGPLAMNSLLPKLKENVRSSILEKYPKKNDNPSQPQKPITWQLIRSEQGLLFFITPPSHIVSSKECVGSELWIRRGRQWLSFGMAPSFTVTESLYWEGCLTSEGRGFQFWPETETNSYLLFSSLATNFGTLYRMTPGKTNVLMRKLGTFSAPAAYLSGQVLHAVRETPDLWVFDPKTKKDRLLLKGPGVEPYGRSIDLEGVVDYIPPRLAELSQAANGVTFSGILLSQLSSLPTALTPTSSSESTASILLEKAKQAIAALLGANSYYAPDLTETVAGSETTAWKYSALSDKVIEVQWAGTLPDGSPATLLARGRAMGFPKESYNKAVFFVDCLDLTFPNKKFDASQQCTTPGGTTPP